MTTVYLGTSAFAAAVLRRVAAGPHRPLLVVTRPDRPRGRGRRLASPPVADVARELGIDVDQPDSVNSGDSRARLAAAEPDAVLICAFGALVREPLLSDHPMLNVHPSLLPRWRGAAPIERAIDAGDPATGVSIMRPTADLDAGPVCLAGRESIRLDDDFASLSARLEELAGELLQRALDERPEFVEQPEVGVTFADKITAEDRRLDPERTPDELDRRVRALTPHVGSHVDHAGERLGVVRARPAAPPAGTAAGELAMDGGRLLFGCAGGDLELLEVKPPGGRAMAADAYARGRRLEPAGDATADRDPA